MPDLHILKVRSVGDCTVITVPSAICQELNIGPGDYVTVELADKSSYTVTKGTPKGTAKPAAKKLKKPPVSAEKASKLLSKVLARG